jgi:hypothetical protein
LPNSNAASKSELENSMSKQEKNVLKREDQISLSKITDDKIVSMKLDSNINIKNSNIMDEDSKESHEPHINYSLSGISNSIAN